MFRAMMQIQYKKQYHMISHLAVVQTDAIGTDVSIAEFAVIRAGVTIGNSGMIHSHVLIAEDVELYTASGRSQVQ
jgi:UDP-3-O-[3-hydroxymyristoyl] glucosamine N-acyltransferase